MLVSGGLAPINITLHCFTNLAKSEPRATSHCHRAYSTQLLQDNTLLLNHRVDQHISTEIIIINWISAFLFPAAIAAHDGYTHIFRQRNSNFDPNPMQIYGKSWKMHCLVWMRYKLLAITLIDSNGHSINVLQDVWLSKLGELSIRCRKIWTYTSHFSQD